MGGIIAAILGLFKTSPASSAPPIPEYRPYAPGPAERELMDAFPFTVITVPGAQAMAKWEELRQEGRGYPVVIGDDEAFSRIVEAMSFNPERTPEAILAQAEKLRHPQSLTDLRRMEIERVRDYNRERGTDDFEEDFYQPEEGEWPDRIGPAPELTVNRDILSGKPYPKVYVAVLPTAKGYEVPAYLRWGGWNENPPPEIHVAALREWSSRYGAELIGMSGDVLNLRVASRPADRAEALSLAREHYLYCNDIVDQGVENLSNLAATYLESDWWYFWWD